jgi:hypothetical protein
LFKMTGFSSCGRVKTTWKYMVPPIVKTNY